MKNSKLIARSALATLIAVGTFGTASQSFAAEGDGMEKCAGIVKAGKNDCATSKNACHGHVKTSGNKEAWIYVPIGTCNKIVGARVTTAANTVVPPKA